MSKPIATKLVRDIFGRWKEIDLKHEPKLLRTELKEIHGKLVPVKVYEYCGPKDTIGNPMYLGLFDSYGQLRTDAIGSLADLSEMEIN